MKQTPNKPIATNRIKHLLQRRLSGETNILAQLAVPVFTMLLSISSVASHAQSSAGELSIHDFPLTTEMHNNLHELSKRSDGNGGYFTDIPRSGTKFFNSAPAISYLEDSPNRAHSFVTFHAKQGKLIHLQAISATNFEFLPNTGTNPIIAVYELVNEQSNRNQLPISISESRAPLFNSAELQFLPPRTGVYALAVYHREPELVRVGENLLKFFHGAKVTIQGDSGQGFLYPVLQTATVGDAQGTLCEPARKTGIGYIVECHVQPATCFSQEYETSTENGYFELIETRPHGCTDKSKLPKNCEYGLFSAQGAGVYCRFGDNPNGRCIYASSSDQIKCDLF